MQADAAYLPLGDLSRALKQLGIAALAVCAVFFAVLYPGSAEPMAVTTFLGAAVWLLHRGRKEVFNPTVLFPAGYCAWFAVGSVTILHIPEMPLLDPIPFKLWAYYVVGLVAYWLAMRTIHVGALGPRSSAFARADLVRFWESRRFAIVFSLLLLVGCATYAYLVVQEGIPLLGGNVSEDRVLIGSRHGPTFTAFMAAFWTLLPMAYVHLWSTPSPTRRLRWMTHALMGFSCALLLSMGSRGNVVIPVLVILILRNYMVRPWRLSVMLAFAMVGYSAISAAGYWRDLSLFGPAYQEQYSSYGIPIIIQPFTHAYFYVRDPVSTFRNISNIIPNREPFQMGAILLSPFASLLPGHHESSDLIFKRLLGNEFIGLGQPATLLGSFYADLGGLGVFLGMLGTGFLAAYLYKKMRRQPSPLTILLFCYFSQMLVLSLFSSIFPYLITLWVPFTWIIIDRWIAQPALHP
jgi:oligosaccharide repeat unit polymerase